MKKGALLFSVFNFGGGESGLPDGGAGRPNGLTEGVLFDEWKQLKNSNCTPFAAVAALPPTGAARQCGIKLRVLPWQ